jgi:ATP:corrinoid adenosyltransferase
MVVVLYFLLATNSCGTSTNLLKGKDEELKLKDELIEEYRQEVVYLREMVAQLSQRPSIAELVGTAQEYRNWLNKYSESNPV